MTNKITQHKAPQNLDNRIGVFSKVFNATMFIALLLAAFTWQCKKDNSIGGTVGICPKVIATSPVNGGSNIATNTTITATFNEAINPATLNAVTFTLHRGSGVAPIGGTISYSNKVATFTPYIILNTNDGYTATITTGVKDPAGNAIVSNYVWTFSTSKLPVLGTAAIMGAFGGNSGITNQGVNTIINNGSIATTATSNAITGFHDSTTGEIYTQTTLNIGKVAGRVYGGLPAPGSYNSFVRAAYALIDATSAYNEISLTSQTNGTNLTTGGEIGGTTINAGTYRTLTGDISISAGNLTLDAQGNPNAIWIFQTTFDLMVGSATAPRNVILINGALARNVYWYVGRTANINAVGGGVMTGTILSYNGINISSVASTTQTTLNGRALCINGPVTMVNTTINVQ